MGPGGSSQGFGQGAVFPEPVGPEEKNIALLHLHIARFAHRLDPLIMIVNRNRQDLLGPFLADNILVQDILYFVGFWKFSGIGPHGLFKLGFLSYDIVAEFYTLVAYVNCGSCNQLFNFILTFPAKGTDQVIGSVISSTHLGPPVMVFRVTVESIIPYIFASSLDIK